MAHFLSVLIDLAGFACVGWMVRIIRADAEDR